MLMRRVAALLMLGLALPANSADIPSKHIAFRQIAVPNGDEIPLTGGVWFPEEEQAA